MKSVIPNLGGHVSCAGGASNAVRNAQALNMKTFQFHPTSPRQWKANMPPVKEVEDFRALMKEYEMKSCYIHAPYLINLASIDDELQKKSIENLSMQLTIGDALGVTGVVFHLGSSKGGDHATQIKQQAKLIHDILNKHKGTCKIILENSAGGGDKIGSKIAELGVLFHAINHKKLGVCIDTAHIFEAGVLEYTKAGVEQFKKDFEKAVGLKHLTCFHVNDSKTAHGSCRDNHANLGDGLIGIKGLQLLADDKDFHHADWVLEVPGIHGDGPEEENMTRLRNLF